MPRVRAEKPVVVFGNKNMTSEDWDSRARARRRMEAMAATSARAFEQAIALPIGDDELAALLKQLRELAAQYNVLLREHDLRERIKRHKRVHTLL